MSAGRFTITEIIIIIFVSRFEGHRGVQHGVENNGGILRLACFDIQLLMVADRYEYS